MEKKFSINTIYEDLLFGIKQNQLLKRQNFFLKQQTILLSFLVGILSGLLAVAFRYSIEFIEQNIHIIVSNKNNWYEWLYLPFIMGFAGVIAGLVIKYVPDASGSGIPEVKLSLVNARKRIKIRNLFAVFIGGVASIGSGFSLGREGPTVKLGAASGSLISKLFRLKGKNLKILVAAGAGAGLASAFNSPIAGVIFIVEELSQNFSSSFLAPCIVATVTAASVTRYLTGNTPALNIPITLESFTFAQLPVYLVLGLASGALGTVFIRWVLFFLRFFGGLKNISLPFKVAIVGFLTGIIGLFLPEVLGNGHDTIEMLLYNHVEFWIIPLFFIFKLFLTAFDYGSGCPGGIFAPTLFCGASLGLFIGQIFHYLFPHLNIYPANIALIGMGCFFTAVVLAPITGIVIIFEMTGGYEYILPLMLSCVLADVVSSKLYSKAIYPALLFQSTGIDIEQHQKLNPLERMLVKDVMTTEVSYLSENLSIEEAFDKIKKSHHNSFPVISEKSKIVGIITLFDIETALINKVEVTLPISSIMTKNIIGVFPETTLIKAVNLLHEFDIGRLIVFEDDKKTKVMGILTRSDIIKAEIQ